MIGVLFAPAALDMPEFARNFDLSCAACRSAFPRLDFLDYIPCRMAGITYQRGLLLDRPFGQLGVEDGKMSAGIFAFAGECAHAMGPAGLEIGDWMPTDTRANCRINYACFERVWRGKLTAHWEHFSHVADMGVRGCGETLAQAFEQAALALTAIITEPSAVRPTQRVEIHCEEADPELLLADWLNALVYEMVTRNMLFSRFAVTIDGRDLNGVAWGEPVDRPRHQPVVEVKGATYTALRVTHQKGGNWLAQCVVDV